MSKKKRKMKRVYTNVEQEREIETEDIYDDEQREKMLEDDEITSAESAFMAGREMKVGKKKKDLWLEERDTTSVELAKEDTQED
ncbi:hypothetical protein GWN65_02400 [Candidatus Bathyarchaeota archaeon]|nr:hypothetical protein [Candidatus Bathyarchaeota archaeon]